MSNNQMSPEIFRALRPGDMFVVSKGDVWTYESKGTWLGARYLTPGDMITVLELGANEKARSKVLCRHGVCWMAMKRHLRWIKDETG